MENQTLDIVKLIDKHPLVKLTGNYQNKLLNKIKETFNESQQQLFIGSFYSYLNHDAKMILLLT